MDFEDMPKAMQQLMEELVLEFNSYVEQAEEAEDPEVFNNPDLKKRKADFALYLHLTWKGK